MSYTPQPSSLAGRVVAHFRAHADCREMTEAQIAAKFTVPLSSVTACLAATVQYKLLDRVRCEGGRMGYAPGRKLHGSNEADKKGLVVPPAPAPARKQAAPVAAAAPLAAPAPAAAPARASTPVPSPAPMAAAVRTLMTPPPPAPEPTGRSALARQATAPSGGPCPVHPPAARSLLARLPAPTTLHIELDPEDEMAQAVKAYHPVLEQMKVGYVISVPTDVAADVYAVCKAWGDKHEATFHWLPDAGNDTTLRIKRFA